MAEPQLKTIKKILPIYDLDELAEIFDYPNRRAINRALRTGKLPLKMFELRGRRVCHAAVVEQLFENMNLKEGRVVEIENIVSANWSIFRSWLLPSLLEFLSRNKHVEYPQKVFEIGDVVNLDSRGETGTKDTRKLAVALTDNEIGYEEISSILDSLLRGIGINYKLRKIIHPSFIKGRAAGILVNGREIGVIGEINPFVLEKWELDKPAVAFEIELEKLMG